MARLPEAWIAPPATRALREQVRHRAKLVALRSGLVHAVLAKQGVAVPVSDLFGVAGSALLDALRLDPPYAARVGSLRRLIEAFDFEIDVVSAHCTPRWHATPANRRCRRSPASGRCWPRCSSPRSATSIASTAR